MACTIWAACCTGPGDYISFVLSRLFGCLAGSCATTGMFQYLAYPPFPSSSSSLAKLMDILGSRSKLYHGYILLASAWQMLRLLQCYDPSRVCCLGQHRIKIQPLTRDTRTLAGPTFSGFIVGNGTPWAVEYWYNVGLEGFVIFLIFFCLEETGWTRPGRPVFPVPSTSFLQRSIDVYFFRRPNVAEGMNNKETVCCSIAHRSEILIDLDSFIWQSCHSESDYIQSES